MVHIRRVVGFLAAVGVGFVTGCASSPSGQLQRLVRAWNDGNAQGTVDPKSTPEFDGVCRALGKERLDAKGIALLVEEVSRQLSIPDRESDPALHAISAALAMQAIALGDRALIEVALIAHPLDQLGAEPLEVAIVVLGNGTVDPSTSLDILAGLALDGPDAATRTRAARALRRGLGSLIKAERSDDREFSLAARAWLSTHVTEFNPAYEPAFDREWAISRTISQPVVLPQEH